MLCRTIAAAGAVLSLGLSTATSQPTSFIPVAQWRDLTVLTSRFNCVSLPFKTAVTHRVKLVPQTVDSDLYLYGYNGSWTYVNASAHGGLTRDIVTFDSTIRNTYNTLLACVWGFGGKSQPDLFYDIVR
jgi:hypothetical protein